MEKIITISADKEIKAYLAYPSMEIKGAIIVIHEVWGLTDHIRSIANRFAEIGYIALAPELLNNSEFSSEKILQLQRDLFDPKTRSEVQPQLRSLMAPMQEPDFGQLTTERLKACFNYLYNLPETQQKVAVVGFCFGGSYSFALAVAEPRLQLALPFYGHADQSIEELRKISCPVRAFYGQNDERLITQLPTLTKNMEEAGVDFQATVYPDCGHAFFNDSNPITYQATAATDAWQKIQNELNRLAA